MVLVLGATTDATIRRVCLALDRINTPFVVLDPRALPRFAQFDVETDDHGRYHCWLTTPDGAISASGLTAIFCRQPVTALQASSVSIPRGWGIDVAITAWLDATPTLVVNRPSAQVSNQSKPFQHQLIKSVGLAVPPTVVTNSADAARRALASGGDWICKSVSGVRSVVRTVTVDDLPASGCALAPSMFQRRIMGTDIRVHVVGDETYSVEVLSDAVDYRYPSGGEERPEMRQTTLPSAVAESCKSLARRCGLSLAGIDLRRTPIDGFYCFEINPSPAFAYYESAGSELSTAVARLLTRSCRETRRRVPTGQRRVLFSLVGPSAANVESSICTTLAQLNVPEIAEPLDRDVDLTALSAGELVARIRREETGQTDRVFRRRGKVLSRGVVTIVLQGEHWKRADSDKLKSELTQSVAGRYLAPLSQYGVVDVKIAFRATRQDDLKHTCLHEMSTRPVGILVVAHCPACARCDESRPFGRIASRIVVLDDTSAPSVSITGALVQLLVDPDQVNGDVTLGTRPTRLGSVPVARYWSERDKSWLP